MTAWLLAAWLAACGGGPVDVAVPDMSGSEDAVQQAVQQAVEHVYRDPSSAAAWAGLGDRLHAHGWDVEAAHAYGQAESMEPEAFVWPYMRALCLAGTDLAASTEALARAIEIDPGYPPAHVRYGRSLVGLGRLDEAERHFVTAAAADPVNPHALLGRAQISMARGEFEDARSFLERALEKNPNVGQTHHLLAQTYLALGLEQRVASHSNAARRLPNQTAMVDPLAARGVTPVGSMANNDRGIELVREGQDAEAARLFEEALRINPEFAEAHYNYGTLLARSGRADEAIRHLRDAVRLGPAHADARVNLGIALSGRGDRDDAERLFHEALEIDPAHAKAHIQLGVLLEADGAIEQAMENYRAAMVAKPDAHDPAWRLAWILATDPDGARRDGAEAVRLAELACAASGFQHARFLDALGAAYAEAGSFTDAVIAAKKAVRLSEDPELTERIRQRVATYESGRPHRP